jgi:hypothetical protein
MSELSVITLNSRDDLTQEVKEKIRKQTADVLILNYPLSTDGDVITDSPFAFLNDIKEFRFKIIIGEKCTSTDKMFFGCTRLEKAPELNLENVQNLNWMFEDCISLTDVPNYVALKAQSARGMFRHCKALTDMPKIKMPRGIPMDCITQGCSSLCAIPELKSPRIVLECSDDVTDLVRLRTAAQDLDEIVINFNVERKLLFGQFTESNSPFSGLPTLDTVKFRITTGPECRSLEGLFFGCNNLKKAPEIDTSNVRNMNCMFQNCTSLSEVPLYETANCTSMKNMFHGCTNLAKVPCFDTGNVETMFGMFEGCPELSELPKFNTSKVKNFSWFLSGCSKLKSIPKIDTRYAESMCSIFNHCTALTEIPKLSVRHLKDAEKLFSGYTNENVITGFWGVFKWRKMLNKFLNRKK